MEYPDPDEVARAEQALDRVADTWLSWHGVISVEVARRWYDGVASNDVGIRVTLQKLLPRDQVPDGQLFVDQLEGIAVDLVEGSTYREQ